MRAGPGGESEAGSRWLDGSVKHTIRGLDSRWRRRLNESLLDCGQDGEADDRLGRTSTTQISECGTESKWQLEADPVHTSTVQVYASTK